MYRCVIKSHNVIFVLDTIRSHTYEKRQTVLKFTYIYQVFKHVDDSTSTCIIS